MPAGVIFCWTESPRNDEDGSAIGLCRKGETLPATAEGEAPAFAEAELLPRLLEATPLGPRAPGFRHAPGDEVIVRGRAFSASDPGRFYVLDPEDVEALIRALRP